MIIEKRYYQYLLLACGPLWIIFTIAWFHWWSALSQTDYASLRVIKLIGDVASWSIIALGVIWVSLIGTTIVNYGVRNHRIPITLFGMPGLLAITVMVVNWIVEN